MVLGIMQPYIFPYIGYFQLIRAVDKFVVYDDVNFIKQGWINRNRILFDSKDLMFAVPLKNQSSFTFICNTEINNNLYDNWLRKFLKTLEQSYKKAPMFGIALPIIEKVFSAKYDTISQLAVKSLLEVSAYLEIQTEIITTSSIYNNQELHSVDRIIDICKKENAAQYINPIGGQELYSKELFKTNGIQLNFVKTHPIEYSQFNKAFVPWLSIIDLLMFNDKHAIQQFLDAYDLV